MRPWSAGLAGEHLVTRDRLEVSLSLGERGNATPATFLEARDVRLELGPVTQATDPLQELV